MKTSLTDYGFVPFFARQTSPDELAEGRVGRVIEVQRSLIIVFDGSGDRTIPLTSSWQVTPPEHRPTVGDWVVLDDRLSRVERVLDRKSVFRRIAPGRKTELQLIAANVDILFIVTSCNEEFRESRLERYLALAAEAGVIPVIVLTKADQSDNPDHYAERARSVRPGVPVECVNALDSGTLGGVRACIEPGSTIALVGSSGVGKSTLLNTLAETRLAATSEIREADKKGRHTTTHRALYRLPGGGLLVDVPGIRELGIAEVEAALSSVFDDIEAIASTCRFSDCRHESEPGCAVRHAVESGALDERRVRNYRKLLRENELNTASLAERRARDRATGKYYRQVMASKKAERDQH
ncbi:MAG: ribosome small subunit-dependent GTPase A [Woeseiaceae bacterium]|jgi:ribosome biogenesis GTPase|nr:ribosome small subunit-dependent GTPase A [Woeseiaceae bacterium]